MEGAAKRLLEALGSPVDGSKGPDATLDAVREAAEAALVGKKSEVSSQKPEWEF